MAYQNIVVVGARGKLGEPLIQALLSSTQPEFRVTAIVRPSSTFEAPESSKLNVVRANFDNHDELVKAFSGQDAAIFTFSADANLASTSKVLIEAAIAAGVKRIIPSEFGGDDIALLSRITTGKADVKAQLETAANAGQITFSSIRCGPWFDYTFKVILGFDLANEKATIYNGGTTKFNTTTLGSVISVVAAILSNPSPYTNKVLHIHDFYTSQSEILSVVEKVVGKKFEVEEVNAAEEGSKALEAIKTGGFTPVARIGLIRAATLGEESVGGWDPEKDESSLFGLGTKDLEGEIKKLIV